MLKLKCSKCNTVIDYDIYRDYLILHDKEHNVYIIDDDGLVFAGPTLQSVKDLIDRHYNEKSHAFNMETVIEIYPQLEDEYRATGKIAPESLPKSTLNLSENELDNLLSKD